MEHSEPIRVELVFRGDERHIPEWRRAVRYGGEILTLQSVAREGKRQDKMVRAVYSGAVASISAS
jgi:hypothetical protein